MSEILKTRTRYIIPFRFGKGRIRDAILSVQGRKDPYGGEWTKENLRHGEQDLYDHIVRSLDEGGSILPSGIGTAFRYASGDMPLLKLCYRKDPKTEKRYNFDITDAGMLLFLSGTGFLWYEIGTVSSDRGEHLNAEELVAFHACFKELNYERNAKLFINRRDEARFSMGNWIAELLLPALGEVTFFAKRKNILYTEEGERPLIVPDKALLYHYTVFPELPEEERVHFAYYLTKGYKESYRIPADIKGKLRRPFGNVLWYACDEGVGYYACADDANRAFFLQGMSERFMNDYFLICLMALNSRYSLISFSEKISDTLPSELSAYLTPDLYLPDEYEETADKKTLYGFERKLTRLVTEIDVFVMKNVRTSVSFVGHQNEFHEYLAEAFRIRRDVKQLLNATSALREILGNIVRMEQTFDQNEELINWRKDSEYAALHKEKEQLKKEMYRDELTGFINQKGYLRNARELFEKAKNEKKFLFVCSLDMNGLKHINDTYGHEDGNFAIEKLSGIIREAADKADLIFRTGGDEFVVLGIRDERTDEPERFANKMEAAMERVNREIQKPYSIAASFGPILAGPADLEGEYGDLFKKSDDLMYEMKLKRDQYRRD